MQEFFTLPIVGKCFLYSLWLLNIDSDLVTRTNTISVQVQVQVQCNWLRKAELVDPVSESSNICIRFPFSSISVYHFYQYQVNHVKL